MALELVQTSVPPFGQFDGADAIFNFTLGGEVATITSVALTTNDVAALPLDGYSGVPGTRPVATTQLTSGDRPLLLVDDGIAGYGTILGGVVGAVAGQLNAGMPGAPAIGIHSALGSGRLTLWSGPGTFAVTLDAVDTDPILGLQLSNQGLAAGAPLYATAAGLLTPDAAKRFENVVLGRFLNFESNKGGSLVNTPVNLVSAQNSPVGQGQPQTTGDRVRALIYWNPPVG